MPKDFVTSISPTTSTRATFSTHSKERLQEHPTISRQANQGYTELSQSELRPGRVLSRPHKTRDGSKRSKKSSGSLRTKQRMGNGEEVEKKEVEEGEDEI